MILNDQVSTYEKGFIMNPYLSSSSLKRMAKGQLLGRYTSVVFVFLLHMLCLISIEMLLSLILNPTNILKFILYYAALYLVCIVSGFFKAGEAYVYLKVASNQPVVVSDLFYCFRGESNRTSYIQIRLAAIEILTSLPAAIYSCFFLKGGGLLAIDGIYLLLFLLGTAVSVFADLVFSQCYYVMLDFEEYSGAEVMKTAMHLMKGNMGRLFYLFLSFFPLYLLGLLSMGIGFLWIYPYKEATFANFYLDLIKKKSTTGQR